MNVFVRILDCCVGYFLLQFTKKSTKFTSRKYAPLSPSIPIRPKNSSSFALPYIHKFSHPRLTFSPKEAGNVLCHPSVPSDLNRGFIIERDRKGRSKSNYLHDLRGVSFHDGRCS